MMELMGWKRLLTVIAACVLAAGSPEALSVRQKIERFEADLVPANSKVFFGSAELNKYIAELLHDEVGDGIRNPVLSLGTNRGEGRATVDFTKLQTAKGRPPGMLLGLLLRGEHDLEVRVRTKSGGGQGQVDVEEVAVDGLVLRGRALELLIDYYLTPRVPEVKIGKPFELKHGVDRFEAAPEGVTVYTGAK